MGFPRPKHITVITENIGFDVRDIAETLAYDSEIDPDDVSLVDILDYIRCYLLDECGIDGSNLRWEDQDGDPIDVRVLLS